MSKFIITYGERAEDVVTLEIANITDASEVFNAAYAELRDRQLAYDVLAAVFAGKFEIA